MIAPQELRLGMFLLDTVRGNTIALELKHFKELAISALNFFTRYEPIELTEEWLFKLGYECHKNEYCISGHDRFNVFQSVKGPYIFCDDEKSIKYVKYVHELQNIFFALTGEYLKIKE